MFCSSNTRRLTGIERNLNLRSDAIELELKNTVKQPTFKALEKRLNILEASLQSKSTKIRKLFGNVKIQAKIWPDSKMILPKTF